MPEVFLCRNPINSIKHQLNSSPDLTVSPPVKVGQPLSSSSKRMKRDLDDPTTNAYWQEGVGKGGDKPWKFDCKCGEKCSSYENYRFHPVGKSPECLQQSKKIMLPSSMTTLLTPSACILNFLGRMFECTLCSLWSHVGCIYGNIAEETLEEIEVINLS